MSRAVDSQNAMPKTWVNLCRATVSLAVAWAEFKLALDAHRAANSQEHPS